MKLKISSIKSRSTGSPSKNPIEISNSERSANQKNQVPPYKKSKMRQKTAKSNKINSNQISLSQSDQPTQSN
uniref:Uncharacterized protein n=1 Tax=Meloidogyne enterolobii TaxID=390850 RepID=A0A6V7U098_MELEN|nr:unnamed protein product [Meloidogyne enterolobii]